MASCWCLTSTTSTRHSTIAQATTISGRQSGSRGSACSVSAVVGSGGMQSMRWSGCSGRRRVGVVCMAPEEEKMTRRSPLDFPIEWERPKPGRRPDIFPQFSPMKTPLPPPLPADPPEEDEEEEEKKEEEDPEEVEPEEPEKQS